MVRILLCGLLVPLLTAGSAMAPPAPPTTTAIPAPPTVGRPAADDPESPAGDGTPAAGTFGWPLAGNPSVVRAFQAPEHPFGPGHRGVDLAGPVATPVLAAGAGTVVFAGLVVDRSVVSIAHPGGLRTTYEPVLPSVAAGDLVVRGQQIGILQPGHPGCPATACLHWGARRGRAYLDPLGLLTLGRVRLLPWTRGSSPTSADPNGSSGA